jgi:rod shape-determining protein MreD
VRPRVAVLAAAVFTALLVSTVIAPLLAVAGFRADLLVLLVVALAYHEGAASGARVGFAAGLLADLLGGPAGPVGLGALVLLLVGHTTGALRPYLAGTALAGQVALAAGASLFAVLGYGFAALVLGLSAVDPLLALRTALGVALYNAVLAPFVFRIVGALVSKFPRAPAPGAVSPWSSGRVSGQAQRP